MLLENLFGNGEQVFRSLPQRRYLQLKFREPVIKIITKTSGADQFFQILVGGCHYAHIHADFLASTKAVIRHAIKNAQQLDLDFGIKVSDFIQEKSAAIGHFKVADFLRVSATESTLLVSKKFAF